MGKEENAGYQHFLLFPQCFQKAFSSRQNLSLFVNGLTLNLSYPNAFILNGSKLLLCVKGFSGMRNTGQTFFTIKLVNSLSNDKILDWSKFKSFADDNLNLARMAKFVFDRAENMV